MPFFQTRSTAGVVSGTKLRILIDQSQTARQNIVATAHASGEDVTIRLTCSGTNAIIADDGRANASATQVFAVDPGFTAWVECEVVGNGRSFDMHLSVVAN